MMPKNFKISFLMISLVLFVAAVTAQTPSWVYLPTYIEDSFDDNMVDSWWNSDFANNIFLEEMPAGSGDLVARSTGYDGNDLTPEDLYISGDFQLDYTIVLGTTVGDENTMQFRVINNTWDAIGILRYDAQGGELTWQQVDTHLERASIPYAANKKIHARIKREGSVLNAYYSEDGIAWNQFSQTYYNNENLRIKVDGTPVHGFGEFKFQAVNGFPDVSGITGPYTDWHYADTVFLNTSASGADVSSDITNFPVLVRLNSTNFRFDEAQEWGQDIRFTDESGTPLSYHIERWNKNDEYAVVWVLVPYIAGNSVENKMVMYWGNDTVSSASRGEDVFTAANDYAGVWHLKDGRDATDYDNDGTLSGTVTSDGIIGPAQDFDGIDDYISVPDHNSLDMASNFTLSCWVKMNNLEGFRGFISKKESGSGGNYQLFKGSDNLAVRLDPRNKTMVATEDAEFAVDTWYHITMAYNATDKLVYFYKNGKPLGQPVPFEYSMIPNNNALIFGREGQDDHLDGMLDEIEISRVQRSADWIKLMYQNQTSRQSLVSIGQLGLLSDDGDDIPDAIQVVLGDDTTGFLHQSEYRAFDKDQTITLKVSGIEGYTDVDDIPMVIPEGSIEGDYNPQIQLVDNNSEGSNFVDTNSIYVVDGKYQKVTGTIAPNKKVLHAFPISDDARGIPAEYLKLWHYDSDNAVWEPKDIEYVTYKAVYA